MPQPRMSWGPSHQYRPPPGEDKLGLLRLACWGALAVLVLLDCWLGSNPLAEVLATFGNWPVLFGVLALAAWLLGATRLLEHAHKPIPPTSVSAPSRPPSTPALSLGERVRARSARLGGGAYLGLTTSGEWVTADPEHSVLVLGPPRSGKTSTIVIPSILAAPGPVVSTATKTDVIDATWRARSQTGQVWLFDPAGEQEHWPQGIRRLSWSPVAAATSWDDALLMARAMASASTPAKGTSNEDHWRERSTALLAPLLHAANITEQPISTVLTWVLRKDLDPASTILKDHGTLTAVDVLAGIAGTDERERSSIFSATAGILAAYNADATRANAIHPNFDPHQFLASTDTIYITAPAHKQALCAPLVVGLLEQIRHATYQHATQRTQENKPPVYLCLDEVANIAPIHDLPALISEAGGQQLHILACLQDLSQARKRWDENTADGLLTLFQTKLILNGIQDPKTLEAISLTLGEYDRQQVSTTHAQSKTKIPLTINHPTHSQSITYNTQRQRTLNPGDISQLPHGRALLLTGSHWKLIHTTAWHNTQPWVSVIRQSRDC